MCRPRVLPVGCGEFVCDHRNLTIRSSIRSFPPVWQHCTISFRSVFVRKISARFNTRLVWQHCTFPSSFGPCLWVKYPSRTSPWGAPLNHYSWEWWGTSASSINFSVYLRKTRWILEAYVTTFIISPVWFRGTGIWSPKNCYSRSPTVNNTYARIARPSEMYFFPSNVKNNPHCYLANCPFSNLFWALMQRV